MSVQFDLGSRGTVQGLCDPAYAAVGEAFVANFERHGEVGASVSVSVGGRKVVDLWGGLADVDTAAPWREDTVSIVYSCTKAATALAAQILVDRGQLDLDAPVRRYWPEFAQAGKDDATVLMTLNHSVGLPALRDPLKTGAYLDWDYMVGRLAAESPFWRPGTTNGYHMTSFGWLVGELVRRVSGKSLGAFFRDEVSTPLGMDFWIGLPPAIESRVARLIPFVPSAETPPSDFAIAVTTDPTSIAHRALMNNGGYRADTRESHAAEIPGAGGIANARALARMYEPLANGGAVDGIALLSAARIDAMRQPSVETDRDETLLIPTRFGQGFMLRMAGERMPAGQSVAIGEQAFGHVGMGGSIGFADPAHRLAMGYTMNRLGGGLLLNMRGQSLIDAAYECLQ